MSLLYNLFIHLYRTGIFIAGFFNPKAKAWVRGRNGLMARLRTAVMEGDKLIWIHCASLGEFEQGRPVIEKIRELYPNAFILLTFFSPSGYDIRKNYKHVDLVTYMPIDTRKNARDFLDLVKPDLAIFVKYEFWFNYINGLYKRKIPLFIISANFRKDQHFFRWYGGWSRKQLKKISAIFIQGEDSLKLLKGIGIDQVMVSGDTRFDRVFENAASTVPMLFIKEFAGGKPVLLAGSTWPEDEDMILAAYRNFKGKMKLILVPHEVDPGHISQLTGKIQDPFILYSQKDKGGSNADILLVDAIGFLAKLYQYAYVAYIGGGFGSGIHNILEAVAFGKPVIFGPNYHKFREAVNLKTKGGAFAFNNATELEELVDKLLINKAFYQQASVTCLSFVRENCGATGIIMGAIKDKIEKS